MKIFISHSWKDKTYAQMVYDLLKDQVDVWLDINNLGAGDVIQQSIDKDIEQMDIIILIWSENAKKSNGGQAEMKTTVRLKKKLLICTLNNYPLKNYPLLNNLGLYTLNLDTKDPKDSLKRLYTECGKEMIHQLFPENKEINDAITSNQGFYQYVEEYRNKGNIKGNDAAYWAIRYLENGTKNLDTITKFRDDVGDLLKFIQQKVADIQDAGNDTNKLQAIHDELMKRPDKDSQQIQVLLKCCEQSTTLSSSASVPDQTAAVNAASKNKRGVNYKNKPGAAVLTAQPQDDLRTKLIKEYINSSETILHYFSQYSAQGYSVSLKQIAVYLQQYLDNPYDLISDNQNGLLGFLDDAWLINNIVYRCIEAGIFTVQQFPVNWQNIVAADAMVIQLFAPQIKMQLDNYLMQALNMIAMEAQHYQPQFVQNTANTYNAFMGGGNAVGAKYQSIDDCFIQVGDKYIFNG